jgi:hypothetical protein
MRGNQVVANEPEIASGGEGTDVALSELLEQLLTLTIQAMAGPCYGKVDTYDSAKDRVSITPLVPLLVAGEIVASPKLPEVPVEWYQLGGVSLKFPLLPGSFMRLMPLGHEHSNWLVNATEGLPPTSERRFSLSDLVAVPLTPSPLATPPDPTSYDSAWAVLFGQLKVGSSAATKAAALNADNCPQVETAINTLAPGSVTPLSTTFSSTAIASITATSTKLKAL